MTLSFNHTSHTYGVATISRHLKITRLFCKRALYKRLYSAKETYNFKEPTHLSHDSIFHSHVWEPTLSFTHTCHRWLCLSLTHVTHDGIFHSHTHGSVFHSHMSYHTWLCLSLTYVRDHSVFHSHMSQMTLSFTHTCHTWLCLPLSHTWLCLSFTHACVFHSHMSCHT